MVFTAYIVPGVVLAQVLVVLFMQREPFMFTFPPWLIVKRVSPDEEAVKRLPDPELLMLRDEEACKLLI